VKGMDKYGKKYVKSKLFGKRKIYPYPKNIEPFCWEFDTEQTQEARAMR
jgi:hypothetical protein